MLQKKVTSLSYEFIDAAGSRDLIVLQRSCCGGKGIVGEHFAGVDLYLGIYQISIVSD